MAHSVVEPFVNVFGIDLQGHEEPAPAAEDSSNDRHVVSLHVFEKEGRPLLIRGLSDVGGNSELRIHFLGDAQEFVPILEGFHEFPRIVERYVDSPPFVP